MTLKLVQLEEIEKLLLEVPALIKRHEKREPAFVQVSIEWLDRLVHAVEQNRLTCTASIAALKGVLLSAKRGVLPPDLSGAATISRRKLAAAAAVRALQSATEMVRDETDNVRARANDAYRIARAALAVADAKGLIKAARGAAIRIPPSRLLSMIEQDEDLRSASIQMLGILGRADTVITLDRALSDVEA